MLIKLFKTSQESQQGSPVNRSVSYNGNPAPEVVNRICQLTAEELAAVAGGPEVQVGDGG